MIQRNYLKLFVINYFGRLDAERKAHEMAVLVADLQRMRAHTARDAVCNKCMRKMNLKCRFGPNLKCKRDCR